MIKKAFTIIELMVVIAIIAFLASIALPRYSSYFAKAKQAEVALILASLHTAEQVYLAEQGTYTTNLKNLAFKPENNNYSYGFFFSGAKEGIHYVIGKRDCNPRLLAECYADKNRFIAKAAGDINGDGNLDVWSIDDHRRLVHLTK